MTAAAAPVSEIRLRVADDPDAAARARRLARDFRGSPERTADARMLLGELVLAAQYEGVEFVDVRVAVFESCLRIEVTTPHRRIPSPGAVHFTPAATIGRTLIKNMSDRWGDDGRSAWCEIDGTWEMAR